MRCVRVLGLWPLVDWTVGLNSPHRHVPKFVDQVSKSRAGFKILAQDMAYRLAFCLCRV